MEKIIKGGFCAQRKAHIVSAVGIISAVAGYIVGDTDVFTMLQAIFMMGGIYFLGKSTKDKG